MVMMRSARTDEDERDVVPIRRRGRSSKPYYEQEVEDEEYTRTGRSRADDWEDQFDDYDDEEDDVEFEDAMEYLEEVLDNWDPTEHPMFGNEVVPNPLLDSIDPDGAADRFPELARDPRFWFEMLLFVAFLDFLSLAGPQDAIPSLPFT